MLGLFAGLVRRLLSAYEHRKARLELADMSDEMLRDIGIDRSAIEGAVRNGRLTGVADVRF